MVKRSIGLTCGAALALIAAIMPGSASMASPMGAGSAPVAWVVNEANSPFMGSVTPIDSATNKIIKKIPVPGNAIAVALTPDGGTAWVALNASRPGGHGEVVPVSTSTYHVGKLVKVASILPETMVITPNGRTLYVGDSNSGSVTPVHTATGTAGRPIRTGAVPLVVAMAVTPDGKTVYVVNEGPGTVTPINTATNTAGKNIKVGVDPIAIVITPDGQTAYVLNLGQGAPGKGTVTPISTATNTAGKPIPLRHAAFPLDSNLMVMAPTGKTIYVAGNTTLTPIDTGTNTARPAIRVAPPHGIANAAAITPDGKTVYVDGQITPSNRGYIVPVAVATGTVGKAIIVPGIPFTMAVTPDGRTLYALRPGGTPTRPMGDVIPVSTATNKAGRAIDTGMRPVAIAVSR
jgi:YVTN family beta-propeller protein